MPAELLSHSQGHTLVLTISNPEQRNALEPAIYAAGIEAMGVAESRNEVRCVVITGAGGLFCAGGNLQRLLSNREHPPAVQAQSIEGLHNWIECIRTFPKPVIAAVEGAAAGAGFAVALACDLMVAASDAAFKVRAQRKYSAGSMPCAPDSRPRVIHKAGSPLAPTCSRN